MRLRDPTVGFDESGRLLLPRSFHVARDLENTSSSSSSSSSLSGSYASEFQNFTLEEFGDDCPSVPTLAGDCNATVNQNGEFLLFTMPCVVGLADAGEVGSCEEPFGNYSSYITQILLLDNMGIAEVKTLGTDVDYVYVHNYI